MTGRSIIIGDVHGCADELQDLLQAVQHTADDRVFFVGDLVARGPDSRAVLDICRRTRAQGVLGNHEARLLEARNARRAGELGPRLGPSHAQLMSELSSADWELLEGLPLTLSLAEHGAVIVHAGIVPGVPLDEQKREDLLKMRALEPDGTATSSWRERSWAQDYHGPLHVIFGHNATSGLQLHPYATGLDSGCVYGGALTALMLEPKARVPGIDQRRQSLVSVPARARYVDFGPRFDKTEKPSRT